ncbi:MAG: NAD(P)H-hydrate dehydratase [Planctomycetes bacterium]|nr:NAD(P)H-hydrate dehydratase [Planctomycetota bacterium]
MVDAPDLPLPALPERLADTHKGDYGSVLVAAGCGRYPGAAILAALGALRMGAGYVHLLVPEGIAPLVLPAVPSCVLHRAPDGEQGGFDARALPGALELALGSDTVVLGPGLGGHPATGAFVEGLLDGAARPLLLDADGLNLLALSGVERLRRRPAPTVLTPHPGELARLDRSPAPRGDDERVARARALASHTGAVVVLKGHRTVTTDGERVRIESSGNPGMARAGMGDVLSGCLGALLARLPDAAGAAALAVHLHARAGDLAADELGPEALLPEDVAVRLGRAVREWCGEDGPGRAG